MRAQQLELLYEYARTAMGASVVAAISIFFVFLQQTPVYVLSIWLFAFMLLYALRYIEVLRFFRQPDREAHTNYWQLSFSISAALAGILWGMTVFVFIPHDAADAQALLYTCMALLYVCGLAAGSLTTYTVKLSSYLSFALPCLLIPGIGLALSGNSFKNTIGLLILIFLLFLIMLAIRINRTLMGALQRDFENARLLKELQQERDKAEALANRMQTLSTQDSLTGIANRRHMDAFLEREWQRSIRLGEPISLILADLDYFKAYNDVYGHPAGDECLKQVAQILHQHARRSSDLAARYGGEEFAIILASTDSIAAKRVAESIRLSVEQLQIPHSASDIAPVITISLGITTIIPRQQDEILDFIKQADKVLYQAKANGRNTVTFSEKDLDGSGGDLFIHHWDESENGPLELDNLYRSFSVRGYRCMVQIFTPDSPIGTHAHIRDEINLILEGEMLIKVNKQQYRLKRGDYVHIPGKLTHEAHVIGPRSLRMLVAVGEEQYEYYDSLGQQRN